MNHINLTDFEMPYLVWSQLKKFAYPIFMGLIVAVVFSPKLYLIKVLIKSILFCSLMFIPRKNKKCFSN
ncbi:hypothetical protein AF332_27330 [Sporosarcina globispora]|uniref:Uncharacterized protein n=1 Tax=Sporosarcina globispora TaxID=1459 RepID=A0A0M0GKX3_SPOGL|nr:hypothetical protein AF332_27330 [Sporosarcina globispora]